MIHVTATAKKDIERFHDFLNHESYGVTQVIVISKDGTKIGYFDNKEDFVNACILENGNGNIYASLNPCPREFLDKAHNE